MKVFAARIHCLAVMVGCLSLALGLPGCGGGGGGSSTADGDEQVTLDGIVFFDPADQNSGGDFRVPDNGSLVQIIEFRFSGIVPLDEINADSLQIRTENNEPVSGRYVRDGNRVVFYPSLPTRPLVQINESEWDAGGAGLQPGQFYNVNVPVGTTSAISTLSSIKDEVWKRYDYAVALPEGGTIGRNYAQGSRSTSNSLFSVKFYTTADPAKFLTGYTPKVPDLDLTFPEDAAVDVSPFLYTDPDGNFAPASAMQLTFDRPLDPALDNVSDQTFKLINLEDESGQMLNIELGVNVEILENEYNRSVVSIVPNGILPFGNLIALVYPAGLRDISGGSSGSSGEEVASVFRIQSAPADETLVDVFQEGFSTAERQETDSTQLGPGVIPAAWDVDDSNLLEAAFSFEGGGELGPFLPLAPEGGSKTIVLDTNSQAFPLFDGSTPDAKPGTVIEGGVFNFTEIIIPEGVTIRGQGQNPLVITATGNVLINGDVDLTGADGTHDQSYDSAITSTPGGPGGPAGGRGGVGNPTVWDEIIDFMHQVPPRFGEHGFGSGGAPGGGGKGGEGCVGLNRALLCNPSQDAMENNGSRGAGGGGGSYLTRGNNGQNGTQRGDEIAISLEKVSPEDIQKPLYFITDGPSKGGAAGDSVFFDEDEENNFIGPLGEVTTLLGGQGGGGGGNRHDAYYCWARYPGFPGVVTESKGGGGGGGGGAVMISALGTVTLGDGATIDATGGLGGCGEQIGCSNWAGGGGGGSGGATILQSASMVNVPQGARVDVDGSQGCRANTGFGPVNSCGGRNAGNPGSGGRGGKGLIQVQVPFGVTPNIENPSSSFTSGSYVDPEKTPSELTPISVAQSKWVDAGQVIRRSGTSPEWQFRGTDPATGLVMTDNDGNIIDPDTNTFKIDLPPVIDPDTGKLLERGRENFIPEGAWVRIEFQGAKAIADGSKEVDETSIVPAPGVWATDIAEIKDSLDNSGLQFLRYRVVFNIADATAGYNLQSDTRTTVMRFIDFPFNF